MGGGGDFINQLKGFWREYKGYKLRHKVKELYWQIRYAWQRAWQGYDSSDIFNMNDNLREKMIVMLEEYDKTRACLFTKPYSLEEIKNIPSEELIMTNEETSEVIQKMIGLLKASNESYYCDENYNLKDGYTYEAVYKECERNTKEFFEIFMLYWNQLWD